MGVLNFFLRFIFFKCAFFNFLLFDFVKSLNTSSLQRVRFAVRLLFYKNSNISKRNLLIYIFSLSRFTRMYRTDGYLVPGRAWTFQKFGRLHQLCFIQRIGLSILVQGHLRRTSEGLPLPSVAFDIFGTAFWLGLIIL